MKSSNAAGQHQQLSPRGKRRRARRIHRYLNGLERTMEEGDSLDLARWMRVHKTPGEKEVWQSLRRLNRGAVQHFGRGVSHPRWRCQTAKYGYIADFYCPFYKLVIEVDGASHRTPERIAKDAAKDAAFARHGIKVARLSWPFKKRARQLVAEVILARERERAAGLKPEPQVEPVGSEHMEALAEEFREARRQMQRQGA